MMHRKSKILQLAKILIAISMLLYACQKKESKERNTIMFTENIESVRIMLHTMDQYLKELPSPTGNEPHNYYIEKSTIYINGRNYNKDINNTLNKELSPIRQFLNKNPHFIELAYRLERNGITATIPYVNCKNSLFEYRPTIESDRGDYRYIAIVDSIPCNYLGNDRDTIIDRYNDIILIADKSNPIYPTE